MQKECIGKTVGVQDGAAYGNVLFRFGPRGEAYAYGFPSLTEIGQFSLDKQEFLVPHANAVTFGSERAKAGDEFPVFYANIYNNYCNDEDKHKATLCVYRVFRKNGTFETEMLQTIRLGFAEDLTLWSSLPDNGDARSYGNIAVDRENNRLVAFVMRDKEHVTRIFTLKLPKISEGEINAYGVREAVLEKGDILSMFDIDYSNFMQGACTYNGLLYSTEGGVLDNGDPLAIRIIDIDRKREIRFINLNEEGLSVEPEMIFFYNGICYYGDGTGDVYKTDL